MEKVKEIELLQSLKGDTYFAQLFDNEQIDAMCENIKNDYPIEFGLDLFKNTPATKANAELKKQLSNRAKREELAAEGIILKASEHLDESLEDIAEQLIGYKKCLAIKLRLALSLSEEDRDTLINLLAE